MIYRLTSCYDDPRFSGFEGDEETFKTVSLDKETGELHIKNLAGSWKSPQVKGDVRQINHYPCINLNIPAFSQYAVQCLEDMLTSNGEALPIISPKGRYYFYNLLKVANILDVDRSTIKWMKKPTSATIIEHYEFLANKLDGLTIFRVPQKWPHVYVTDRFVKKALAHNLTGLRFTKLWPLAPGEKGEVIEAPINTAAAPGTTAATEQEAMAQSVYLDVTGEATPAIDYDEFEAALNRALEPAEPLAFAIGHVEYSTMEEGFHRFFLSCPDADALANKIDRFLRERKIRDRVRILVRYGPFDNVEAPERELSR